MVCLGNKKEIEELGPRVMTIKLVSCELWTLFDFSILECVAASKFSSVFNLLIDFQFNKKP